MHEIELAIKSSPCKGWKPYGRKFQCSVTRNGKTVWIGSFNTQHEAENAVFEFKLKEFIANVSKFESDVFAGKVWRNIYVVYPSGRFFNLRGEVLKGGVNSLGYLQYVTRRFCARAHRIVATLFIPNPDNKPEVNHIDGNKLNNCVSNLEWCTKSENITHAIKTGLAERKHGEQHPLSKLKESDILYIRSHYKKGDVIYGCKPLAIKFGVDAKTMLDVIRKRTWKHITESAPEKPSEAE